jgi:signal recognition particle GTPase
MSLQEKLDSIFTTIGEIKEIDPGVAGILIEGFGLSLNLIQEVSKNGGRKDIDISDDAFKGVESIISSMTPFERANPDVIDMSRKKRIASGCGRDMNEVNQFFKQFEQMKQMMKMMNNMPMGGRFPGMKR